MPRFHLHQRINADIVRDVEGSDFADLAAARKEAILAAREMMSAAIYEGLDISGRAFEIADEAGNVVMVLPFKLAIAAPQ